MDSHGILSNSLFLCLLNVQSIQQTKYKRKHTYFHTVRKHYFFLFSLFVETPQEAQYNDTITTTLQKQQQDISDFGYTVCHP